MATIVERYRYITRQAGVRAGNAIVEDTRIGVHDVIGLLQNSETVDSIIPNCFPTLTKAQVYECLAYYEDHRGEIDLLVARQMSAISKQSSAETGEAGDKQAAAARSESAPFPIECTSIRTEEV